MNSLLKLFLALLLCLTIKNATAQYVTLPDTNFRNFLISQYPSCFNSGKQMDTTCISSLNITSLDMPPLNISNLSGIQYFNSLLVLDCGGNELTNLPALPSSLTYLACDGNDIKSLPDLQPPLHFLSCDNNPLTNLPTLPASLTTLSCNVNELTSLPALPASLNSLYCDYNNLTSLPVLPASLYTLWCNNNQLTNLPALPISLTDLECDNNQLTSLTNLPPSLELLFCGSNQLTSLPALPTSLDKLFCDTNNLQCLPILPAALNTLYATGNYIKCLPNLPTGLTPSGMDSAFQVCNDTNNIHHCTVQQATAITNSASSSVMIVYPNPSTGSLQLSSSQTCYGDVVVANAQGKTVFSQNSVNLSSTTIDLSSLAKGLYFVQVSSGQSITTQKLVLE